MATAPVTAANDASPTLAHEIVDQLVSNEIVFAVVGPVGSGTSEIASALDTFLSDHGFDSKVLKARSVISAWAEKHAGAINPEPGLTQSIALQDAGDAMRLAEGNASVAVHLIEEIRRARAAMQGKIAENGLAVIPDEKPRSYVIDSLRNPAEVVLLRRIYQQAFCLVGVVCEEDVRLARLQEKYKESGKKPIEDFMLRDEKAVDKHGQQVADTFHLSDFFIDNSQARFKDNQAGVQQANPEWIVVEELGRLVDILTHGKVVRPRPGETAMYHAYGARMRSACLSRQVGAALVDARGNLISTGTNEVPRAGGGVYGSTLEGLGSQESSVDHRCFIHGGYCRNTREQNGIIKDLVDSVDEFKAELSDDLLKRVRKTKIGQLVEFSRAVHAEMEAILAAARQGKTTVGTRLFVTTYPYHNCARHIVAAGVDEVQFIEPYLKSKALPLHGDAITSTKTEWLAPSAFRQLDKEEIKDRIPQVLFRPFTGVAPRLYRKAFYKDRDLKNDLNGDLLPVFPKPDGSGVAPSLQVSYADVEAALTKALGEA